MMNMTMPANLTNPCMNGRFDLVNQKTILVLPAGVTYSCLLNDHRVFSADGEAQIDDVIGIVTASTPTRSAFTFYHSVFWQTARPIMQDDQLNLWVTYLGWDDKMNMMGSGNLNVGAHLLFHSGKKTPTFFKWENNVMVNQTLMMPEKGIPMNSTTNYTASSLNINTVYYAPETNSTWAGVYLGTVAPFSLLGHPNLKYGQTANYTVSYSYFGADGNNTTGTSDQQSALLVDMGAVALTLGSAAIATALLAF